MRRRIAVAAVLTIAAVVLVLLNVSPAPLGGTEHGPATQRHADDAATANDEASSAESKPAAKAAPEAPPAPATLAGRVTEGGLAVARAEVRIALRGEAPERDDCAREDVQATSGGGGFTSAPLCPGQYDVVASSNGKRALHALRLGGGERVDIELSLQAEGALEVSASLADGGHASHAEVSFRHAASGVLVQSKANGSGVATLSPAAIGRWTVEAWREDLFHETATADVRARATARVRLVLDAVAHLTGEVVDETGAGHEGVKLRLLTAKASARDDSAIFRGQSGDGGSFSLGPILPGAYVLQARGGERIEKRVDVPSPPVRLVVPRGARVEVQLLHEGSPTAGLVALAAGDFADGEVSVDAGVVVFPFVPVGPGTVVGGAVHGLTPQARVTASKPIDVRRPLTRVELEVATDEVGVISGRCSLLSGHALPSDVKVIALGEGVGWKPSMSKNPSPAAMTRMAGRLAFSACTQDAGFALSGLVPGRYLVMVEAAQNKDKFKYEFEATAPAVGVDVPVPGLAWFRFRVVDPAGQPVERWGLNAREIEKHPGGRYEQQHYSEEAFALSIHSPGYVTARLRIDLHRGEDLDLGDIKLSRESYLLTGRVVSAADESPVAGADVYTLLSTTTDERGSFELGPMQRRDEDLTVWHSHFKTATVPLRSTDPLPLTVRLQPAGWIRGQVLTHSGAVSPKLSAVAFNAGDVTTDAVKDGLFDIGPLEPGAHVVRLESDDDDVSAFDPVRVEVRTGAPTEATFVERAGGTTFEVEVVSSMGELVNGPLFLSPSGEVPEPRTTALYGFQLGRGLYRFRAVPAGQWTLISSTKPRATQTVVVGPQLAPRLRLVVPEP